MNAAFQKFKAYWPTLLPALIAGWAVAGPQIKEFLAAHPVASVTIMAGYAIFTHLMPSPVASGTATK